MRYSEIQAFNSCPYKYKLTYIDRLEKIDQPESANDRTWGAAMHKALELYYRGASFAEMMAGFKTIYPEDLKPDDLAKTIEGAEKALEAYIAYYKEQDKDWQIIDAEVKSEVENEGMHEMTVDLVAKHLPSGSLYLWDHKTTGKTFSYTYWKQFELSAQITRYTAWAQQKYGECAGFYINGIAVGHRQRAYKGEPAGYWQRFERQLFNRSAAQIEAWKKSDQAWMRTVAFNIENNIWPKAYNSMCSYCDFHELCTAADDEQVKEALYRTNNSQKEQVQK